MLAFHRWDQGGPGDDVVVVVNCAARAWDRYRVGLARGGAWQVRFNGDWQGYGADFGNQFVADPWAEPMPWDGKDHSAEVGLGAYAASILTQRA